MLLIAKLPSGSSKFIPLLLAKVNELLSDLLGHVCETIQVPISTNRIPMSTDTRFVYEEEVGRGLHADLRRTLEREGRKMHSETAIRTSRTGSPKHIQP